MLPVLFGTSFIKLSGGIWGMRFIVELRSTINSLEYFPTSLSPFQSNKDQLTFPSLHT